MRFLDILPLVALIGLGAGCTDDRDPSATPDGRLHSSEMSNSDIGSEDPLLPLTRQIDGFAGLYYDDGVWILLKVTEQGAEPTITSETKAILANFLGADPPLEDSQVRAKAARFTYAELYDWFTTVHRELPGEYMADVTLIDLAEGENLIRIGVRSDAAVEPVSDELLAIGIPEAAFEVETVPALQLQAAPDEGVRSVPGVLKVEADATDTTAIACSVVPPGVPLASESTP